MLMLIVVIACLKLNETGQDWGILDVTGSQPALWISKNLDSCLVAGLECGENDMALELQTGGIAPGWAQMALDYEALLVKSQSDSCSEAYWISTVGKGNMDSAAINRLYLKQIVELAHRSKKGFH
jgi:hypothetical protein